MLIKITDHKTADVHLTVVFVSRAQQLVDHVQMALSHCVMQRHLSWTAKNRIGDLYWDRLAMNMGYIYIYIYIYKYEVKQI